MVKELRSSFNKNIKETDSIVDYYIDLLNSGLTYLEDNEKLTNSIRNNSMLVSMMKVMPNDMPKENKKHLPNDINNELLTEFLLGGLNQVSEWWFIIKKILIKMMY